MDSIERMQSPIVHNVVPFLKRYETAPADSHAYNPNKKDNNENKHHERKQIAVDSQILHSDKIEASIDSLILFLEDFLENRLHAKLQPEDKNGENKGNQFSTWMPHRPSNGNIPQTQNAIKAYRRTTTLEKPIFRKESALHDDIKDSYTVLCQLRVLKKRGIFNLTISNQKRFIDSIWDAVSIIP
tara:strand:+ start:650 stop:1204 length:555 start_codon:yes stop_codon:yes gene_type:complete